MSTRDSVGTISGSGNSNNVINVLEQINHIVNINNSTVKNISLNWLPVATCFTGREDILRKIKEEFTKKNCVVLHGLPGIGKTETARKFGSRYSDFYNGNLIWIFSETSDNIKQCFDNLATSLDLKITDASQIFNQFKTSKALIVFDNAESMAEIKDYLPSNELHKTVDVLITSRYSNWGSPTSISKIPLNSLNMVDALSIFKQKLGNKFEEYQLEKWEELVEKLDGIPLCLQIVSSQIQQEVDRILLTKFNLENFIEELEENFILSTIPDSEQDYYPKSVDAAINSVLSRLEKVNAIYSLDLLCFVAYLDADHIDVDDLLIIPSIVKSEHKLDEALKKLVDYSLIQIVKESSLLKLMKEIYNSTGKNKDSSTIQIKVHRTVQLVLRDYDLEKRNGDMFKTVLSLSVSDKLWEHKSSIFGYANKKEYLQKTIEIYYEKESLIEEYVKNLVIYNYDKALKIILPEFKNDRTDKFIDMLFNAINWNKDLKTIQVFFKSLEQNEEDVRQIEDLPHWRSTKLIDILLESNILKNRENVSENNIILKNSVMGRFLHLLVRKSNKENVKETIEFINHLIYKCGANILYQDDDLNNILHVACENEEISLEIIECLFQLENGKLKGIVDCQNKLMQTPLHYLCRWDNENPYLFEIIEFILREINCSQIINDQDKNGNVAFSQLIWNNSIEEEDKINFFNLFLKCGMNVNLKNKENKTLLEIAEEKGLNNLTEIIKDNLKELEHKKPKG